MPTLTFLNHASFCVETEASILLVDPWLQGTAFHNGWALLDGSTSNDEVLAHVGKADKKLYIWYSHEHSDHFAVPFIKQMKAVRPDAKFVFHATLDKRVASFLRRNGYAVIESPEGVPCDIDPALSITTWPYAGGDSFSLIKAGDTTILNINDCAIRNIADAQLVKQKVDKQSKRVDLLFTQFGYANWVGNEDERADRRAAAQEKFDRIQIQDEVLQPVHIVPFASFVYFCHPDNFYLNDEQNNPASVRSSRALANIQHKIFFLRPRDAIHLSDTSMLSGQLGPLSPAAEKHWNERIATARPLEPDDQPQPSLDELIAAFKAYRRTLSLNFAFSLQLREVVGRIKPINILLKDKDLVVRLSYLTGIKITPAERTWNMSVTSEVFLFMLKNEYGFNATRVNGRFRIGPGASMNMVIRFFSPQDHFRNGLGIRNPLVTMQRFITRVRDRFLKVRHAA